MYIEALNEYSPVRGETSLFLAGGITGCNNWQNDAAERLHYKAPNLVLLNPRRENFPIDDPSASEEQIRWEHKHLRLATAILFWFPEETLCPITLFEYGRWLAATNLFTHNHPIMMIPKKLFVGCSYNYQRRSDVIIQTSLERPTQVVHNTLYDVLKEVEKWNAKINSYKRDSRVG